MSGLAGFAEPRGSVLSMSGQGPKPQVVHHHHYQHSPQVEEKLDRLLTEVAELRREMDRRLSSQRTEAPPSEWNHRPCSALE